MSSTPAVWFPAIRAQTGTDVFTERLVQGLKHRGVKAEITWLPLRAEYAPWSVPVPKPPAWATIAHVNSWLHPRFIPKDLAVVATVHHAIHHPAAQAYKGPLRAAYHKYWIAPIERQILCLANQRVAVSQFVAESTQQTLLDVPIQVIYNGVDTELFQPSTCQTKPSAPFQLLFVGSWMSRKGVDLLAPIMAALGPDFELSYTGGPSAAKNRSSLPDNMHDIGRLQGEQAVSSAMQRADALLFPSRSEGHPLVAIEAMACGLTVIGMQGTAITEALDHGSTGFLCPAEDIGAFVSTIRKIAARRDEWRKVGLRAREQAVKQFAMTNMLDRYSALYAQLSSAASSAAHSLAR